MVVQLDYSSEQLWSMGGDTPSTGPGDFGDQGSDMQPFEQATDLVGLAAAEAGITGVLKELSADVLVAESVQQMVALENGLKQPDVVTGSRIKASVASLSDNFSLREPGYLLVGPRRVMDDRESFQMPVVGGSGNMLDIPLGLIIHFPALKLTEGVSGIILPGNNRSELTEETKKTLPSFDSVYSCSNNRPRRPPNLEVIVESSLRQV